MAESEYVCRLDEASQKVALAELFEDPKNRMEQIQMLRDWIDERTHISAPTDSRFLLKFLRSAKFSQLRAREILEGQMEAKIDHPGWLNDIDTCDPKIHAFMRTGYLTPIVERDEKGRKILIIDEGCFKPDHKLWDVQTAIRTIFAVVYHTMLDENTMVNGIVFLEDFSHVTMKHVSWWGMDNITKLTKLFDGRFPGRYKAFHYYNPGTVFEAIMKVMRPFLSKTMQERFFLHGKNLETIYQAIPKHLLTTEYLPDDYKGASQGSRKDVLENLIKDMQRPEVRERILYETNSKWKIDKADKPVEKAEVFRKLNVD